MGNLGLSKVHVLIAMPVPLNFTIDVEAATFCASACARGLASWIPMPSRTSEDARTAIIHSFLHEHKPATHLFFLDADTAPVNIYALEKLLSHNKDVIAGVTPCYIKNSQKFRWSVRMQDGTESDKVKWLDVNELPEKPFIAEAVGGTTLLIKRHVLEKMTMPYQYTVRHPQTFAVEMSEDIYFSKKIQSMGFDIWVDPAVECHHRNMVDLLEFMKQAEQCQK